MKKLFCIFVVLLIVVNVFRFTIPISNNSSQLTLVQLEARADEPVETDPPVPPDPDEKFPPTRSFPSDWTLSAILDYFF